jgi:hypothetical protein
MPACRKPPAFDDRHLVPHVGMHRVVDAEIEDDLARLEYGHGAAPGAGGTTSFPFPPVAALIGVNSRRGKPKI